MNLFVSEVMNFVIVLVVAIGVAAVISSLYATGLRLWARGVTPEGEVENGSHLGARIGSCICFALCVFIVLFALWLMIPLFH